MVNNTEEKYCSCNVGITNVFHNGNCIKCKKKVSATTLIDNEVRRVTSKAHAAAKLTKVPMVFVKGNSLYKTGTNGITRLVKKIAKNGKNLPRQFKLQ